MSLSYIFWYGKAYSLLPYRGILLLALSICRIAHAFMHCADNEVWGPSVPCLRSGKSLCNESLSYCTFAYLQCITLIKNSLLPPLIFLLCFLPILSLLYEMSAALKLRFV